MSNAPEQPKKALGKGLSALFPGPRPSLQPPVAVPFATPTTAAHPSAAPAKIPIGDIHPNPLNPRSAFSEDKLEELAQSIRANGIIQPLVVRRVDNKYQIIAGERRWRASKRAGLTEVPVVIQDFADDRLLEIALIENIQREDLNPIEVAHAFQKLAHDLKLSHEEIGTRTGKDRTTITNMLRLLRLPPEVQQYVAESPDRMTMGHARAILGLPTADAQRDMAAKILASRMSVRQVEQLVQKALRGDEQEDQPKKEKTQDPNVKAASKTLESVLGTRVRIVEQSPKRGRIEIEYYSPEDLDRIYTLICGETN